MIKILILLLLAALIAGFGYSALKPGGGLSNPSDAIEGAKDAVGQTQNLQDKINQGAQDQLYR